MDVLDAEPKALLSELVGKECWSVIAGPGTGSMVTLAFGEKIRRTRPIKNPSLSEEQRQFEGEFVVFIKDAYWCLYQCGQQLCTSNESNEIDGPLLSGLRQLVGKPIISASVIDNRGAFELANDNGFCLKISCTNDRAENYSLHHAGQIVSR